MQLPSGSLSTQQLQFSVEARLQRLALGYVLFGNFMLLVHPQALFHASNSADEPGGERIGLPSLRDGKPFGFFQSILLPFPGKRACSARQNVATPIHIRTVRQRQHEPSAEWIDL